MTTKAINKAIHSGQIIVLRCDPWLTICHDLFGDLMVDTRRMEPFSPRLATLADKRQAVVFNPDMMPKRKRRTLKRKTA